MRGSGAAILSLLAMRRLHRVNIGCGTSPTPGYLNFDGSSAVWLARIPFRLSFAKRLGILSHENLRYIEALKSSSTRFADATRRIPLPDASVEVLYSSHMLEHLPLDQVPSFLAEARRVLAKGGILRLAVPDLRRQAEQYLSTNDADDFVAGLYMTGIWSSTRTLAGKLRFLMAGAPSCHKWMYDGTSLVALLSRHGFDDPIVQPEGVTRIEDPGSLDLFERCTESVFVEALR